jgi:hypothetical protein
MCAFAETLRPLRPPIMRRPPSRMNTGFAGVPGSNPSISAFVFRRGEFPSAGSKAARASRKNTWTTPGTHHPPGRINKGPAPIRTNANGGTTASLSLEKITVEPPKNLPRPRNSARSRRSSLRWKPDQNLSPVWVHVSESRLRSGAAKISETPPQNPAAPPNAHHPPSRINKGQAPIRTNAKRRDGRQPVP